MKSLESKVQHNTFETGEFIDIAYRSCEEVVELIKDFKWEQERYLKSIELTGPSVTIENDLGEFLKLSPYYNGKFCLYFLNEQSIVFRKVVDQLDDAFDVVIDFFNGTPVDSSFKKLTQFVFVRKHFVTDPFVYTVTWKRVLINLNISLIGAVFYVGFILFEILRPEPFWAIHLVIFPVWFLYVGMNLVYFFNYYWYCNDQYIRISKGINEFEFGMIGNGKIYSKTEINKIINYVSDSHNNPYMSNEITEIHFNNADKILIPGLLMGSIMINQKMSYQIDAEKRFRFFPRFLTVKGIY